MHDLQSYLLDAAFGNAAGLFCIVATLSCDTFVPVDVVSFSTALCSKDPLEFDIVYLVILSSLLK